MGDYYCMSLDNARQEIESIGRQISDLSALAITLSENDNLSKNISSTMFYPMTELSGIMSFKD